MDVLFALVCSFRVLERRALSIMWNSLLGRMLLLLILFRLNRFRAPMDSKHYNQH